MTTDRDASNFTSPLPSPASTDPPTRRSPREVISRVKGQWRREGKPDAIGFLAQHGSIRQHRSLAIELAYEEYCLRRERGEPVDVQAYCRKFPTITRSLIRQIEVDEYVREHPQLMASQQEVDWPNCGDPLFGLEVVEEIGRGAFARVYLCSEPGVGNRHVVVKVSRGGEIEAQTMGTLTHPNIAPVYTVRRDAVTGWTGICMPFVGRSTLCDVIDVAFGRGTAPKHAAVILEASRSLVRRGDQYQPVTPRYPVDPQAPYCAGVIQIGLQLAEALVHAHDQRVLHGDLKPTNIVMTVDGVPMVVDFNLSVNSDSHAAVTGGTLPYMAPEQIRALLLGADEEDRVDQRADIFALGAILYEMLHGTTPFGARQPDSEPLQMAGQVLDAQTKGVEPAHDSQTSVDQRLDALAIRCLAYEPQDRPGDMAIVADELAKLLSDSVQQPRWSRRAAFVLAAGAATLSAGWLWSSRNARPVDFASAMEAGFAQFERQDFKNAVQSFSLAVTFEPDSAVALFARAVAALSQFRRDHFESWFNSATRDLQRASMIDSRDEIAQAYAYCLVEDGSYEVAAGAYDRSLSRNPNSLVAANNGGYAYLQAAGLQRADREMRRSWLNRSEELLRRAMLAAPNRYEPHLNFAVLQIERCRASGLVHSPREGLIAIRHVIRLNPHDGGTFWLAASLAGLVARVEGDAILREESVRHLIRSMQMGYRLSPVGEVLEAFEDIIDDPRVRALREDPPYDVHGTAAKRTILPQSLTSPRLKTSPNPVERRPG